MRRTMITVLALTVLVAGLAYVWRGSLALIVWQRAAARALAADVVAALPDGLHVGLCGTGSPLPDATRSGPCSVVIAGPHVVVIDAGDGSARSLGAMGVNLGRIDAVLLTHFHSDHIDGLGGLMLQRWIGGSRTAPLPVYGPQGVDAVVAGFNAAYRLDRGYRIGHHGMLVAPPQGFGGEAKPFDIAKDGPTIPVLALDGLTIAAFPVLHAPVEPAVGYVVTYKGRKAVLSGDTAFSPRVEAEAQGADLLVHEALAPEMVATLGALAGTAGRPNIKKIMSDIIGYHTAPEDVARLAERAKVRRVVLTHIVPALPWRFLEGAFLGRALSIYGGTLTVGHDGELYTLPADSKDITATSLTR